MLKQWRSAENAKKQDVASLLEGIIAKRTDARSSKGYTLGEVNTLLQKLQRAPSSKKNAEATNNASKDEIIRDEIIPRFCASEQKWLLRIIFGASTDRALKIGLTLSTILSNLHPNATEIYDSSVDLKAVCDRASKIGQDAAKLLHVSKTNTSLRLMHNFRPMLSLRANSGKYSKIGMFEAATEQMNGTGFVIETKIDGERMIFHKKGNTCLFKTRQGNDYSVKYSVLMEEMSGILQRNLSALTGNTGNTGNTPTSPVNSDVGIILDGEVVSWDPALDRAMSFGTNRGTGNREREMAKYAKHERSISGTGTGTGTGDGGVIDASMQYRGFGENDSGDENDVDRGAGTAVKGNGNGSSTSNSINMNISGNGNGDGDGLKNDLELASRPVLRYFAFDLLYLSGPGVAKLITEAIAYAKTTGMLVEAEYVNS